MKTLSMKGAGCQRGGRSLFAQGGWRLLMEQWGPSLYRRLEGRTMLYGSSLRWRISERAVYATRVSLALAGAKGSLWVSMCQIASADAAGDVDLGDFGAALFAESGLVRP